MNFGALSPRRVSDARCLAAVLADGRVTRYSVGECCDIVFYNVFVLIYLIVFITDFFIWKWRTNVCWFILFASWTADRLFGWLFSYLFSLVGWSISFGWLVGFSSFRCWLTARLTAPRSFHSLVSQNTGPALITTAGSPGVSGHRKFETLLIV